MAMAELRSRFLSIYANLPANLRKEVIVIVGEEPYTWNVVYLEVKAETPLGETILKKLVELELL